MNCHNCQTPNPNSSLFCQECGCSLPREIQPTNSKNTKNLLNTKKLDSSSFFKWSMFSWIGSLAIFFIICVIGNNYTTYPDFLTSSLMADIAFGIIAFLVMLLTGIDTLSSKSKKAHVLTTNHASYSFQSSPSPITKHSKPKAIHQIFEDNLEDVIFVPKTKSGSGWLFWLVALAVVIFVTYVFAFSDSNNSFSLQNPTPTPYVNKPVLIGNINIDNTNVKWIGNETYFMGTMKNNNSQAIKNIVVRVDFAWDKAMAKLFDTRYVTVSSVPSRGAFTFQLPVSVYQTQQYWYQWKIESIDTY